jgi:hypothetical protein
MGTLKLRELSLIHNTKTSLSGSAGITVYTYCNFREFEFKGLVSKTNYGNYGCCTSTAPINNTNSQQYENMFVGLETRFFPSSYRNMKLVTEWVDFMNNLFPFFDIKIITDFEQNIIDKNYWVEQGLRFTFNKDKIYFVIKKDITRNQYFNLFQLSLLRYFVSNEYYFMIYDCLRLRKLKSLSKLSNWQIMDIARFGVQTNTTQFINVGNSSYEYAFLRDYRSPIFNRFYATNLSTETEVVKKLNDGNSQNNACSNHHLALNVIYLMKLFQLGHYIKLYKLINNPKYFIIENKEKPKQLLFFIQQTYGGNQQFDRINNLPFNQKEYEKTL